MPFTYSRVPGQTIGTVSSIEPVGFANLAAALDSLLAGPPDVPMTAVLVDLRTLMDGHISQAASLAQRIGGYYACRHTRLGLLVSGLHMPVVERALAMYLTHQGVLVQLFTDPASARAWLVARATGPMAPASVV